MAALLNATAMVLASSYLLALLPVAFIGFAANADYDYLDCPGAMQCSDAAFVRTIAVVYIILAPLVWLLWKLLRFAARSIRTEEDA